MKNKCSNKIALRSGNSPYIIACSIPHQTNTLAHNTHTHTLAHTLTTVPMSECEIQFKYDDNIDSDNYEEDEEKKQTES